MQGKGLVKLFLVLMALVCLLQFWYFVPTNRVEKDAVNFAELVSANAPNESKSELFRDAKARYLDSMGSEVISGIPGMVDYTYNDLKRQQLALGLDLKGGMSVVLEVDLEEMLVNLAGRNKSDPNFVSALAAAKVAQKSNQSDFVTLFAREFVKVANGARLANIFQQSGALGDINLDTSDGEVERMLREKADETVGLTFQMLKERINRLGVAQPNVSLDANRDLILVELPGIDNPERARQNLQASAELGFWETYRFTDAGILSGIQEADRRLKGNVATDTSSIDSLFVSTNGPLLNALQLNDPTLGLMPRTVVGIADKNKRAIIDDYLARTEIKNLFPKNLKFLWSYKPYEDFQTGLTTKQYELYAIKMSPGSTEPPLTGDVVVEASQTLDQVNGEPQVQLVMNSQGARKWADLTAKAYQGNAEGNQREVAIVLDNEVVTAPSLNNGAITGGISSISGSFNIQEAVDLANILEVGKLPAKTRIIQQSTVGPSLGQDNINRSLKSLTIGFLALLGFIIFYYAKGGIVSVLALLLNLVFIFGTLSSFGTVLTLPGIAGIILTIGMAVDANVIIFERIKEELRDGKSMLQSIADGFKHSYSAIIDANVTTILVALVLSYFGLGPIKGFAVVLIIGVISSLFTAVLVGKLMIDGYSNGGARSMSFWTGATKNAFANLNIDWIGKRKTAYVISGILLLASLASIFTSGFNLGVDFKGGHAYTIQFPEGSDISPDNLRSTLTDVLGGEPVVKKVDVDNTFNVLTSYLIDDSSEEATETVNEALYNGLVSLTGSTVSLENFKNNKDNLDVMNVVSYSKVGPTIADDIKSSSGYAGVLALLLIFLYIFIRFSKWQYSLGAVAALFHDSIIMLGVFSLLKNIVPWSLEVDQNFIAALLTVIGYSINDTVIVFDRIRENFGLMPNKHKDEVLNTSINQTFSRTVITSTTTLVVVLVLFLFGGASIKGFAFAILIGIIVGTYSSIFVATPIVRDLTDDVNISRNTSSTKPAYAK